VHNICITHAASQDGFDGFAEMLKTIYIQWFNEIFEEIEASRKSR
jgi:hypothetical protein